MDVNEIILTVDEIDTITLILVKRGQATEFLKRVEFPEDMSQNVIAGFFKSQSDTLAEMEIAQKKWWKSITAKYQLDGLKLSFDIETEKLKEVTE